MHGCFRFHLNVSDSNCKFSEGECARCCYQTTQPIIVISETQVQLLKLRSAALSG